MSLQSQEHLSGVAHFHATFPVRLWSAALVAACVLTLRMTPVDAEMAFDSPSVPATAEMALGDVQR